MLEEKIQQDCFLWFHNTFIEERGMLHHNNNNSVNRIAGNRNKAMGVVAGVSDFELILTNGKVAFIEMKTPVGQLSQEQKTFSAKVVQRGHLYFVCRSLDEFKKLVNTLLCRI